MVDRWGDFDADELLTGATTLHGGVFGIEAMMQAPTRQSPRKHPATTGSIHRPLRHRPVRAATTATPLNDTKNVVVCTQQLLTATPAMTMFQRICDTHALRCKLDKLYALPYQVVLATAGPSISESLVVPNEAWTALTQRIARRYSLIALDAISLLETPPRVGYDDFVAALNAVLGHFILDPTIAACFEAVTTLFDAIVDAATLQWRPLESIAMTMAPPLSLAALACSASRRGGSREMAREAYMTQEENLKRKLRLRKYLSLSNPLATVQPDEAHAFVVSPRNLLLDSRQGSSHRSHVVSPSTQLQPKRGRQLPTTKEGAIVFEKVVPGSGDELPPLLDPMVLVCADCLVNEALYWCSPCYSMFCITCWPHRHQAAPPTLAPDSFSQQCAIVQSKSLSSLGPPLPLLGQRAVVAHPSAHAKPMKSIRHKPLAASRSCVELRVTSAIQYLPPVVLREISTTKNCDPPITAPVVVVSKGKVPKPKPVALASYLDARGAIVDDQECK
ncbi:hypothetical protein SPRG_14243 [Saprolegnia parasitica CBS 223.65]|uniref:B box-type domain-containing protein n=1 Tax=Saprolegnia parasitica (strain CBS 223.65) TaxID=695850 RepID=A0A067BZJ9_SAPPC|nr:hypothetical protein SPRG_14243 [Saprolegnia parasitica CBS 223.65]KDO19716.1 hypothetical protein SPRG_14243 [Saprolegnia parasitica CBS 223.65]|eukprot:XP_012209575.1 hypothetical protein SPRG_14243 [Saprolegnia parasitica CBS 223.65]